MSSLGVSRRTVLGGIGALAVGSVAGCLDRFGEFVIDQLPHVSVQNGRDETVTASVELVDPSDESLVDETVEIAADEDEGWDDVWTDTGTYTLTVALAEEEPVERTIELGSTDQKLMVDVRSRITAGLVASIDDLMTLELRALGDVGIRNESEKRVSVTTTVTGPDGETLVDAVSEFDEPDEEQTDSWDDVWSDPGTYELSMETGDGRSIDTEIEDPDDDELFVVSVRTDALESKFGTPEELVSELR